MPQVFELTEELKAPRDLRRRNRPWRYVFIVLIVGYAVILIATEGTRAIASMAILTALTALIAIAFLGPAFLYAGKRSGRKGVRWKGMLAIYEDDDYDPITFPLLTRTDRGGVGRRQPMSGGYLSVCDDGMRWKSGGRHPYNPRSQITGTFFIPWHDVYAVDVSYIPYKYRWLGGSITLTVGASAVELGGEFLGRKTPLIRALEGIRAHLIEGSPKA
jgi:hypothetical protein